MGWIGFDLDGTLAVYGGFISLEHIGEPIPAMVGVLKKHLAEGVEVRIVTARVGNDRSPAERRTSRFHIEKWCQTHIGIILPVTCEKDFEMWALYDDRAIAVEKNTGRILGGEVRR